RLIVRLRPRQPRVQPAHDHHEQYQGNYVIHNMNLSGAITIQTAKYTQIAEHPSTLTPTPNQVVQCVRNEAALEAISRIASGTLALPIAPPSRRHLRHLRHF